MRLQDPVSVLPKIGPVYVSRLEKLGIQNIEDLLTLPPNRFADYRHTTKITDAKTGEMVTIKGKLNFIKNQYSKSGKVMQIAEIEDESGKMKIVWFNQPYLIMSMRRGLEMNFSGKVEFFGLDKALMSPDYEIGNNLVHTGRLVPIYPETYGVTSKWLRSKIAFVLKVARPEITDYIPLSDLKNYSLLSYKDAVYNLHFPNNDEDYYEAKKRLAFNELLSLLIQSNFRKEIWKKNKALYRIKIKISEINKFIAKLPFKLTPSQNESISEMLNDIQKETPMNRLLEGDVGSGKTVVAAICIFAVFLSGYQSVIMAPTQILAKQHFETLQKLFNKFKIRVKLVTSGLEKGDSGTADIYVGTHALIHRIIESEKVALVVIDEQHRFGVEQRTHLVRKTGKGNKIPHVLTMTATPIPRTVALTIYGDLDLSILKEMPKGRKYVTTWIVPSKKRGPAYEWIMKQINENKAQVFFICPLIEESEYETLKTVRAVVKEYQEIKNIFKNFRVDILHGRLKESEKDKAIKKFKSGKTDILVSTPVVEVGIDIPNAQIMVIEGAERFGLAQLHQLRGRVGRSDKKSYCLLMPSGDNSGSSRRLNAMKSHHSGFELAEIDLSIRGPGEIFGTAQHGFFNLKNASWGDTELIKKVAEYTEFVISNKRNYKTLITRIAREEAGPN